MMLAWRFVLQLVVAAAPPAQAKAEAPPEPSPVVQIDAGKIRGAIVGEKKDVIAYRGIPYAKPPVGDLRWKAPQAAEKWDGVKDCFKFGSACPQRTPAMMKAIPQMAINAPYSEDCLYLNVWRPADSEGKKLPVLVWIHGGGYTMGAASQLLYDGEHLARKGAVFVSMNYRLGPYGFLSHPALSKESKEGVSGNYGIRDQIESLKWVKRNVAAFGGDPERVTIFGESAGGGSVLCLMVSPLAKGLFSNAISQSAPEMNLAFLKTASGDRPSAEQTGIELVEKCGLSASPTVEELRKLDAEVLLKVFPALEINRALKLELSGIPLPVAPVVDGVVIPDSPNAVFAAGKENPVPMMIGTTRDEATMFLAQTPTPKEEEEYIKEVKEDFGPLTPVVLAAFPGKDARSIRDAVVHICSDAIFGAQARHAARLHAKNGYPTYRYVFSRGTKQFPMSALGAHHACELSFLFGRPSTPDEADKRIVDLLQGYWVNFAAKGDPNGAGLPNWPRFSADNDVLVEFEKDATVREKHRSQQLDAIDQHLRKIKPASPAAKAN